MIIFQENIIVSKYQRLFIGDENGNTIVMSYSDGFIYIDINKLMIYRLGQFKYVINEITKINYIEIMNVAFGKSGCFGYIIRSIYCINMSRHVLMGRPNSKL